MGREYIMMGAEAKQTGHEARGRKLEVNKHKQKQDEGVRYGIAMTRNDTRIYEYNCLEQRKGQHVKNIEVSVEDRPGRYRD
jgi:hypothetical protein